METLTRGVIRQGQHFVAKTFLIAGEWSATIASNHCNQPLQYSILCFTRHSLYTLAMKLLFRLFSHSFFQSRHSPELHLLHLAVASDLASTNAPQKQVGAPLYIVPLGAEIQ